MSQAAREVSAPDWLARLRAGERRVLARAITAVENERDDASAILGAIADHLGHAHVIGVTGPPGAGKSTLVSALIGALRASGRTVAVVAVDPSSPISGGAILGDRIRMEEHAGDAGVFIRSLASRGHLGGLSRATARVVDVLDASGRDVVIVETVGAGQSEVEIAELADTKVVVSAPGLGDDVQAIKAGILEIADVLVVNKGDIDHARRTASQLEGMLGLVHREGWRPPVLSTIATTGEGVAELLAAIDAHAAHLGPAARRASPRQRVRRLLANLAAEHLRARVLADDGAAVEELCEAVLRGELDFAAAAERLIAMASE